MGDLNTERDPLEVLAAEYMERLRQGLRPSIEEYATRHPELAEEIRELFPTITVTERLKARQARSSDGRATLGPVRLERLGDFRLIREARIHDKLGSFHRQMERWAEAEQSFRKAVAIQSPLVKQFPDVPYHGFWMATYRIALADALLRRNQPGKARTELEETISTLLRQLEQRPEVHPPHDLLALGYSKLEIALRETGERRLAEEAARKAEQERNAARRSP